MRVGLWSRRLGDGVGQAFEEVLEFLVLVNCSLSSIVPLAASGDAMVSRELESGGSDEGTVLVRFGGILEGDIADTVTERRNVGLGGDVEVYSGWAGGFGSTGDGLAGEVWRGGL